MINCQELFEEKKKVIKNRVSSYKTVTGKEIKLAIIQVGDNPVSNVYVRNKQRDCEDLGIVCTICKFKENVYPGEIMGVVKTFALEEDCKGIIIPLPLPESFTEDWKKRIFNSIPLNKDVDGFREGSYFIPCTPKGVLDILDYIDCDVKGKVCCVIGRSKTVGKPLANLLIEHGATVISCNSNTSKDDLEFFVGVSDIVISAVGKESLVKAENVLESQIVIDVGINRNSNGELCGDCDPAIYDKIDKITPVPGGVGLMTRISLLDNLTNFVEKMGY